MTNERTAWPWLEPPKQRLREARSAGRLPHALLLVGPPGIGKRRLADWIAAAALCETASGPCGRCASCLLIAAGNHPDLMSCGVQEDASSIKVEQIRDLIGSLSLTSFRGGFKVAINDPADRLNNSSFSALLKTH